MKSNLIKEKYETIKVSGLKSPKEIKSFFGSKLIDIEDNIYINNISIKYSEVVDKINSENNHYQPFSLNSQQPETLILKSLDDIKIENHTIDVYSQKNPTQLSDINQTLNFRGDEVNKININEQNFEWIFNINAKNILREYLFLRLKESRVFKTIKSVDLKERNINNFIKKYINDNLLDRYNINGLELFIKYFNVINQSNIFIGGQQILKNPNYNKDVFKIENKINDVNIITPDYLNNLDTVKIIYNQIKMPNSYKFDYYYTISYIKI